MNVKEIAGLKFIGFASTPEVNAGRTVPLYDMVPPVDGRTSINTLEGWRVSAYEQNCRSFFCTFGREPKNDEELNAWLQDIVRKITQ